MNPTTTTAITTTTPAALAPSHRLAFTEAQETIIRRSLLSGATPEEAAVLLEVARLRGLNPITRQIHFVQRSTWNAETKSRENVWAFQVAIDGLRAIAERTGEYEGTDEPETTEAANGQPLKCRVLVWRKGRQKPSVGVARFAEYAQFTLDGKLTKMWREKPFLMLEKCAEALALRRAFPEDMGGLLEASEMEQQEAQPVPVPAALQLVPPLPAALQLVSVPTPEAAPTPPSPEETAERATFSAAIAACADLRALGRTAGEVGTAFLRKRIGPATREALLKEHGSRRLAIKDASKTPGETIPAPPEPTAETIEQPATEPTP